MKQVQFKKWLSFLLVLALLLSTTPFSPIRAAASDEFAGGSGTESDPYLIETKEQLNNVRNDLDAHYKMVADIVFTEEDFAEGGDFYNDGAGWEPLGSENEGFTGTFDGNGHTITGLKIDISEEGDVTAGLFGYVKNTEIKNLGMVDTEIKTESASGYAFSAGIVGYVYTDATITNCYNTGSIAATTTSTWAFAGSIAGYVSDSAITDCYNTGVIAATSTESSAYIGGIVGYAYDTIISDCSNTGAITAASTSGATITGGIVGYISDISTVTGCCNTEVITATSDKAVTYIGGIAGISYNEVIIADCYNKGTITATANRANNYTGGIVGYAHKTSTIVACSNSGSVATTSRRAFSGGIAGYAENFTINNCSNTGMMTATSPYDGACAGGIVGCSSEGSITNCYNAGIILTDANVGGESGGIIGSTFGQVYVSNCYNVGTITANSADFQAYAGGIAGTSDTIDKCYNTGTVTANCPSAFVGGITGAGNAISNCYNTGTVTVTVGGDFTCVAGIVGWGSYATITNCYNTGIVEALCANVFAGGIVGSEEDATITTCYYLNIIGQGIGSSNGTDTTTSCTEEQMMQQATFVGFDFEDIWTMEGDPDYLLPELPSANVVSQGISINKDSLNLYVGATEVLTATVSPYGTTVTWESSDPSVATVDSSGKVTAVASGIAIITAVAGSYSNTCTVYVDTLFAGGSGTEDDPYIITTKAHLNNVHDYLSSHFRMDADIEFTEEDFAEGGDFYNRGNGWSPIGYSAIVAFTGIFDGNDHSITGLKVVISEDSDIYAGLFGYTKNAVIKNLSMVDSEIQTETTSGLAYAGGIVGYACADTTITDCHNTGSVTATSEAKSAYAGGIVGYADKSGSITIADCHNTGVISATSAEGYTYASGMVAYAGRIAISNCYNTGAITATSTNYRADAGGMMGCVYVNAEIVNCYNTGAITAGSSAGGIAGYSAGGDIGNCYNTGTITAGGNAGGIAGFAPGRITNCYNTGSISAGFTAAGIVGHAIDVTVTNCYNTGAVTVTSTDSDANAGGIVGYAFCKVASCYNTGAVTAFTETDNGYYDANAGGIVGYSMTHSEDYIITTCYNTGDVAATSVNTAAYSGGIVGYTDDIAISNCYNTGIITAASTGLSADAGGIIGCAIKVKTTCCYYLNNISTGVGVGEDTAVACTEDQMKQQSTFVGFDFDTVWTMEGNASYLYPELQSVPMVGMEEIPEELPGDINGDNELNNKDATRLFQYLSGWTVEVDASALDINGDGEVNNKDATRLFQYLSGWDVVIY